MVIQRKSPRAAASERDSPARTAGIPRPEYPRPQFVRSQWQNLNGYWDFHFDDENKGLEQRWFLGTEEFPQRILVPFSFEAEDSGIGDRSFHPRVWYRREFTIAPDWTDKRILLHFGAVDYRAMVWGQRNRDGNS